MNRSDKIDLLIRLKSEKEAARNKIVSLETQINRLSREIKELTGDLYPKVK